MASCLEGLHFEQLHIDVARNTTDDFNPFHDPQRWHLVRENPFGSPIVLGFQTAFLISDRIEGLHRGRPDAPKIAVEQLPFSNYEFRFVGALRPGELFDVLLRKTVDKVASGGGVSTRALIRKQTGDPVLMASQSETTAPKFLTDAQPAGLPNLAELADRQRIPRTNYFLKRKYLTTSNGKNFVLSGLATQQDYFDELDEFVQFPPVFTAALMSCGLLEKAWREGYDFEADPVALEEFPWALLSGISYWRRRNINRHADRDDVRAVVVSGTPPAFCVGGDSTALADQDNELAEAIIAMDEEIDQCEVEIDRLATEFIARASVRAYLAMPDAMPQAGDVQYVAGAVDSTGRWLEEDLDDLHFFSLYRRF